MENIEKALRDLAKAAASKLPLRDMNTARLSSVIMLIYWH